MAEDAKKQLLKEMKNLTNDVIELNKRLFELCTRLHDLIEIEEEKKQ